MNLNLGCSHSKETHIIYFLLTNSSVGVKTLILFSMLNKNFNS